MPTFSLRSTSKCRCSGSRGKKDTEKGSGRFSLRSHIPVAASWKGWESQREPLWEQWRSCPCLCGWVGGCWWGAVSSSSQRGRDQEKKKRTKIPAAGPQCQGCSGKETPSSGVSPLQPPSSPHLGALYAQLLSKGSLRLPKS